jgi:hypothetical protein
MTFSGFMPQSRFHTSEMLNLCFMLYAYALIHTDTYIIGCLQFTVGLTTFNSTQDVGHWYIAYLSCVLVNST